MKDFKKKTNIWQGLSFVILLLILSPFFYLNFFNGQNNGGEDRSNAEDQIQKIKMILPIAPMDLQESRPGIDENVYYGHPNQLEEEIILTDSGKKYVKIGVEESNEEFVHFDSINNPRIRHISEFDPNYERYIVTDPQAKYIRKSVKEALVKMLDHLPSEIGIIFVNGYISPEVYEEQLLRSFTRALKDNPDPRKAYSIACAAVPRSGLTGGTISLAIYDVPTKKMMDLDNTHEMGVRNETFSTKVTEQQKINRLILLEAAIKAGFVNYGMMWWYFAMGEKMHAYINDQDRCKYGPVTYNEPSNEFMPYEMETGNDDYLQMLLDKVKFVQDKASEAGQETIDTTRKYVDKTKEQVGKFGDWALAEKDKAANKLREGGTAVSGKIQESTQEGLAKAREGANRLAEKAIQVSGKTGERVKKDIDEIDESQKVPATAARKITQIQDALKKSGENIKAGEVNLVSSFKELNEFAKGEHLVILKTFIKGCRWCDEIEDSYQQLAQQYKDHKFLEADMDVALDIAKEYRKFRMPTIFIFYKDRLIDMDTSCDISSFREKLDLAVSRFGFDK